MEEWKLTREKIKNEIYEGDKKEIDILKNKLINAIEWEERGNIYRQLSEKYKMLFWGYAEEPIIFKDTPKEEYYKRMIKDYLWNSIYHREKSLRIIKEHGVIEANYVFFMDIGLKFRYFIENRYDEYKEDDFWFEKSGNTEDEKINIIINDLDYAKRGLYYIIKNYEKKKNHEELFYWYEVMGDLYLIIQLLMNKGGKTDLLDDTKLALENYKKSKSNLKFFEEPTIHYSGIYGLPYQTNFFNPLLKSFGFKGYSQSSIDKMEFIEKRLLKRENGFEFMELSKSPFYDDKTLLNNKIELLIEKHPELIYRGLDFEDWKTVVNFIHDKVLSYNFNQRNLNNIVNKWEMEPDMQKWLQLSLEYLKYNINESFLSGREIKKGGGNCDHYYKNITISDKWKRDTNAKAYPTKINEFIDKVYKDHYGQVKYYANDSKLAVIVVVDSREYIKNNPPALVKECYDFKINEQDGIIIAIFVIQVSEITPSESK